MLLQLFVFDRYQQTHLGAANLAQGLAEASLVRRLVAVHYAEYGELLADNQMLGLGPPDSFATGALDSLEVRHGNIVLTFNEKMKEGAVVALRAERSESGVGSALKWACESASLSDSLLRSAGSQCEKVEALDLREKPPSAATAVASTETLINALHMKRNGLVREIIDSGINLNVAHHGIFPLEMAIDKGDAAMVDAMLKAGADPNRTMKGRDGMTMLAYASKSHRRSARIIRALLSAGGKIEARDKKGRTPLMLAAHAGNTTTIDTLVKAGAELEAIDHRGNGAMNYAAAHGHKSSIYQRLASAKNRRNEIIVVIPERN